MNYIEPSTETAVTQALALVSKIEQHIQQFYARMYLNTSFIAYIVEKELLFCHMNTHKRKTMQNIFLE
jgi:hypothetical protein